MKLAERLKELRQEKNLSVLQVATHLCISRRSYSYYEQGQRQPDLEMLIKIAAFFDVSTDYLLGL
ncbi:MAG: helix-turn-helix domain-containing protein [Firmicutes bacterium]|nr:helix-turn-helix domain-containing protein [Bacillota bacterium]